jgi:nitrile hydratase
MNGPQDLGGQMGFGPIAPEPNEPIFHAEWERRALGISLAAGAMGHWNIDASRHKRENRNPVDYYSSSYYEIWIKGLEAMLIEHGFITPADLAAGRPVDPATRPRNILAGDAVTPTLARQSSYIRPVDSPPRFAPGQRVRTRNMSPTRHTRLPRYARGKLGVVVSTHGAHVFPDSNAHYEGEAPQHLYTVEFTARELWGPDGDSNSAVSIDAWESYLEPA